MQATSELLSAVEELKGIKPRAIAQMIARRKIHGRPGTTGRCPLALLMSGAHGGRFIVGQTYIMRQAGGRVDKMRTPANLAAFVRMFDAGQFTNLIQVPPRCERDRSGKTKRVSGPSGKRHARKRGAERLHLARDVERFKRG